MIPDDLRRQKRAYRAGLMRAGSITAAIASLACVFGWMEYHWSSRTDINNFSITDIGPVAEMPFYIWMNNTGKAVLAYSGKPARLLDINSKQVTQLTEVLVNPIISDSGVVAGTDKSIINEGDNPIVWFSVKSGQQGITQIIPRESTREGVIANSKGHILFDNTPYSVGAGYRTGWSIYDPALREITVEAPMYLDNVEFNSSDDIYGNGSDGTTVKFSRGTRTLIAGVIGSVTGVTDGGDLLTQDDHAQTCYLQGGSFGHQEIDQFRCDSVPENKWTTRFINNNGYIIGSYRGIPLLWSALTRTCYDLRLTDGWRVSGLGTINDKDQILALGTKENEPTHFVLIHINENRFRRWLR
jgi:hypothetical protein